MTKQPKKMLAMQILDVLNKHSDAEHRLTQQDIARLLEISCTAFYFLRQYGGR